MQFDISTSDSVMKIFSDYLEAKLSIKEQSLIVPSEFPKDMVFYTAMFFSKWH